MNAEELVMKLHRVDEEYWPLSPENKFNIRVEIASKALHEAFLKGRRESASLTL